MSDRDPSSPYADKIAGRLAVHSRVGLIDVRDGSLGSRHSPMNLFPEINHGHSWVEWRPKQGPARTFGFWRIDPDGLGPGFRRDVEFIFGWKGVANRSMCVTWEQEVTLTQVVIDLLNRHESGELRWTKETTSSFIAAAIWNDTTGEALQSCGLEYDHHWTLAISIRRANSIDARRRQEVELDW